MSVRRGAFLGGLGALGLPAGARAGGFARALVVTRSRQQFAACEAAFLNAARRQLFPARYERTSVIRGLRGRFPSANGTLEVWCLDDLVPAGRNPHDPGVLERIALRVVGGNTIALVAALETAASASAETQNGDVIIGTNTFASDLRSRGHLVSSAMDDAMFRNIIGSPADRSVVAPFLLTTPLAPVRRPAVIADRAFVALSPAEWPAYRQSGTAAPLGCLDPLPALIRTAASAPFFFVSGITHRAGDPSSESAPRFAQQEFAAAYNAGMAVAAMAIRVLYYLAG